jgi:hypothetical protein
VSCWVRARVHPPTSTRAKTYTTFTVCYRRGGRGYRVETAGTFPTQREAKLRRDLVGGWLAGGLDPVVELAKLDRPTVPPATYAEMAVRYRDSRIDVAASTTKAISNALANLVPIFGPRIPADLTVTGLAR